MRSMHTCDGAHPARKNRVQGKPVPSARVNMLRQVTRGGNRIFGGSYAGGALAEVTEITADTRWGWCGVKQATVKATLLTRRPSLRTAKEPMVFAVLTCGLFVDVFRRLSELLATFGAASCGSSALLKLGRSIPWEIKKTATTMISGSRRFLVFNWVESSFMCQTYIKSSLVASGCSWKALLLSSR